MILFFTTLVTLQPADSAGSGFAFSWHALLLFFVQVVGEELAAGDKWSGDGVAMHEKVADNHDRRRKWSVWG